MCFNNVYFHSAKSLSDILNELFAGSLEISSYSNLPSGSGMGGSSILAATILGSIDALFVNLISSDGKNNGGLTNDMLIYFVSQVEQRLTTGGGWQDQVSFTAILRLNIFNNHF